MIIARKSLLRSLDMVMPALGGDDTFFASQYFWFDGERLMACNGKIGETLQIGETPPIGLATPRATSFKGGIAGSALFDTLSIVKTAAAVELRADGDRAVVKLGHARVALLMLPLAEIPFALPAMPEDNLIAGIAGKFLAGIEHCLQSVRKHSSIVETTGVTIIPNANSLALFSTDRLSLSHAHLPLPKGAGWKRRVTFSAPFCEQMLRLAKQAWSRRLAVHNDQVLFAADDVVLSSSLLSIDQPIDFAGLLERKLPNAQAMVAFPRHKLARVIKQAAAITGNVETGSRINIGIKDGVATFCARSAHMEAREEIRLPGHPDVDMAVHGSLLHKADVSAFDKVLFSEDIVVMAKGNLLRVIAARERRRTEANA
jgi:DNA polymerase III sliding clamp (beta) subunit (PCNA family)